MERTTQRTRDDDDDVDVDALLGDDADADDEPAPAADDGGSRLEGYFDPKVFLLLLVGFAVTTGVAATLGGAVPLVGGVVGNLLGLVGIFAAAFVGGAATATRRYAEHVLAGALVALGFLLVGNLTLALAADLTLYVAGGGAVAGGLLAALGHYFGRDLREGLTREV